MELAPDETDLAILRAVSQGRTTLQVARDTGLSERTIRRRLRLLADAWGVGSTVEVVVRAVREGLV